MRIGMFLLVSILMALGLVSCSSEPEPIAPKDGSLNASPLLFDFTKETERKEGEPIDPKTCKHVFVAKGTRPYVSYINGMPMTRMGYIHKCMRCGIMQTETKRVLGGK